MKQSNASEVVPESRPYAPAPRTVTSSHIVFRWKMSGFDYTNSDRPKRFVSYVCGTCGETIKMPYDRYESILKDHASHHAETEDTHDISFLSSTS